MKVMLLAAGKGERLRPLTDQVPKPLIEVRGKPLIVHHIERLQRAGFREIVINLGHLGHKIEAFLGRGERFGVRIFYSREGSRPLETGGGILKALPLLSDPFLVIASDILTDYPFERLKQTIECQAHLILVPNPPHHLEGDFGLKGEKVVLEPPRFTYSGIALFRKQLFKGKKPGHFPLRPLLEEAIRRGGVSGELYRGVWHDVGTIERLREVRSGP